MKDILQFALDSNDYLLLKALSNVTLDPRTVYGLLEDNIFSLKNEFDYKKTAVLFKQLTLYFIDFYNPYRTDYYNKNYSALPCHIIQFDLTGAFEIYYMEEFFKNFIKIKNSFIFTIINTFFDIYHKTDGNAIMPLNKLLIQSILHDRTDILDYMFKKKNIQGTIACSKRNDTIWLMLNKFHNR